MNTVELTVRNNLCISCGICRGVCNKDAITYQREKGMFLPVIDPEKCAECGMCLQVCPSIRHEYRTRGTAAETVSGTTLACYNAWSLRPEVRHIAASGGVVTALTSVLLEARLYDVVFTLDTYDYRNQLRTKPYTAEQFLTDSALSCTPKSRYLPVSHEETVRFLKANTDVKAIIIGTPCAIRGIRSVLAKWKRKEDNYLFVGLFCDLIFNYNVLDYFRDMYCLDTEVEALHFKNKESGGWPGDMKFFPKDREPFYRPLAERAEAKAYFMPERCLYCIDKLNAEADISLGDNYTRKDSSSLGSNSVIIRTEKGLAAWKTAEPSLEVHEISLEDITAAQVLDCRLNNLYFGDLKVKTAVGTATDLNPGVPREKQCEELRSAWNAAMKKRDAGAIYLQDPKALQKAKKTASKSKSRGAVAFLKRVYRHFRRVLKSR